MNRQLKKDCPLCNTAGTNLFYEDKHRIYLVCPLCSLVFVPSEYHLSPDDEKHEYDLHENDIMDKGYRRFLSRLADPMRKRLVAGMKGLDFGCGPGPALAGMMEEHGFEMDLYDPFYYSNADVFSKKYDFITATEVVEHLHKPGQEFELLSSLLKSKAWLGIMTKLVTDKQSFSQWHYIRDFTHVCFYCQDTFKFIADKYRLSSEFVGNDVILMQKL